MKVSFLLTLAGLAIGLAVPSIAQQKDTADPRMVQRITSRRHLLFSNRSSVLAQQTRGRPRTFLQSHLVLPLRSNVQFLCNLSQVIRCL
jgi:hypothetical protein